MDEIQALRNSYEGALLQLEGVVGIGTGEDETGRSVLVIYTSQPVQEVSPRLPKELLAGPVRLIFTGRISAQGASDGR